MPEFPHVSVPDSSTRGIPPDLQYRMMGMWKTLAEVCYAHRSYNGKPAEKNRNLRKAKISKLFILIVKKGYASSEWHEKH
jgi:hypothetical protein